MPVNIICLCRAKLMPVSFHEYFLMIEKDFLTVAFGSLKSNGNHLESFEKGNPAFRLVPQDLSNER